MLQTCGKLIFAGQINFCAKFRYKVTWGKSMTGVNQRTIFYRFLSPFKNVHSAFSFDCMIRKVFSDHAIKWKSAVRIFERR